MPTTQSPEGVNTLGADPEKQIYYYHPDHLGRSSYISNLEGELVQHIEYVPFGETFLDERNDSFELIPL